MNVELGMEIKEVKREKALSLIIYYLLLIISLWLKQQC